MRPNPLACHSAENGSLGFEQKQNHRQKQQLSQHHSYHVESIPCYFSGNANLQSKIVFGGAFRPSPHVHNFQPFAPHSLTDPKHTLPTTSIARNFKHGRQPPIASFAKPTVSAVSHLRMYNKPSTINLQRIKECAGIPLISTASTHQTSGLRQRSQRKSSVRSPAQHQKINLSPQAYTLNSRPWNPVSTVTFGKNCHLPDHLSPPQLSSTPHKNSYINANWSPIVADSVFNNGNFYGSGKLRISYSGSLDIPSERTKTTATKTHLPFDYSRYCVKKQEQMERQPLQRGGGDIFNGQYNRRTSDEMTETSLPRIIKPRKRRKKDKKPTTNGVNERMNGASLMNTFAGSSSYDKNSKDYQNKRNNFCSSGLSGTANKFNNDLQLNLDNQAPESFKQFSMSTAHTFRSSEILHNLHGIWFCQQCDPLRRIWDHPLRRSFSDSSGTSASEQSLSSSSSNVSSTISETILPTHMPTRTRAEIVGVIGSNRVNNESSGANDFPSTASPRCQSDSQSDSNDSGFGDILSGINIVEDIFCAVNVTSKPYPVFPTVIEPNSSTSSLLLHPGTAETLLNESINEISRKLMETCNSGGGGGDGAVVETEMLNLPPYLSNPNFSFSNNNEIARDELEFNFSQLTICGQKSTSYTLPPSATFTQKSHIDQPSPNFNMNQTNFLFPPTTESLQLSFNSMARFITTESSSNLPLRN